MQSRQSDPANIDKLQKQFLNCLLSKRTMITAYLYDQLKNAQQINHSDDPYQQMFMSSQSPEQLLPILSASVYEDMRNCLDKFLKKSYEDGMFWALKETDKEKPASFYRHTAIENSQKRSYDLIKSAILSLCSKLYTNAHVKPMDLKLQVEKDVSLMFENVSLTESVRQKVFGAVGALKSANIKNVVLKAEYRTAGDDHVCPICQVYERRIMTLSEVEELIPQHPRCRCWFDIVEGDVGDT